MIEGGTWRASTGPSGGWTFWEPPTTERPARWQSPRRRGRAQGGNLYFQVRASDALADAPFHRIVESTTTLAWEATFEPFKDELPKGASKWLSFGHLPDPQEVSDIAASWARIDDLDPRLQQLWPNSFIRDLFVKTTDLDLALSAGLAAAISVDSAHGPVVAARMRAGEAEPVLGQRALHLYLPMGFTWADIAELRRHKALTEYRAVLRDVETLAMDKAVPLHDLDGAIREAYADRVAKAEARRPTAWAKVAIGAIGMVAGVVGELAVPGTPGVGAVAGAAAHLTATEAADRAARPRWLSLDARLRRPRP